MDRSARNARVNWALSSEDREKLKLRPTSAEAFRLALLSNWPNNWPPTPVLVRRLPEPVQVGMVVNPMGSSCPARRMFSRMTRRSCSSMFWA